MAFIYFITAGGQTYVGQDKYDVDNNNSRIIQHCNIAYGATKGRFLGSEELIQQNGLFQTKITYDDSLTRFDNSFQQFKTLWTCNDESQAHLDFYEIVYSYRCPNPIVNRDAGGQATYTCNIENLFKYWELQKVPDLNSLKQFITKGLSDFAEARQKEGLPAGQVVTWTSKFQDKSVIRNLFYPDALVFGYAVMGSIHIKPTSKEVGEIVDQGIRNLATKQSQIDAAMAKIKSQYQTRATQILTNARNKWGKYLTIPASFSEFELSNNAYKNLADEWLKLLTPSGASKTFNLPGARFAVSKIRPAVKEGEKEPAWMPQSASVATTEFDTRPWALSLFVARFDNIQGTEDIKQQLKVQYPNAIQQRWDECYGQHMRAYYGTKWGPLVPIESQMDRAEEIVRVGRANLRDLQGNPIELFTADSSEWNKILQNDVMEITVW